MRDGFHAHLTSQSSSARGEPDELLSACPRSSYSSQSSSCASPLPIPRIEGARPNQQTRRLSPSRLSGGSFEVALNLGKMDSIPPVSNQLLGIHLPKSVVNKPLTPIPDTTPSFPHPGCINYSSSPLSSIPTTPTSPPKHKSLRKTATAVTVHVHESEN